MERKNLTVISIVILTATVLALILIYSVLKSSFIPGYDLSSQAAANIGSVIGGVTAPIFTLLSAILVYMAFVKQTESNDNQRLKNDSDIVFLLFNQLEQEIRDVESRTTTRRIRDGQESTTVYRGQEAFYNICTMFKDSNVRYFGSQNHSSTILYILQSFEAMEQVLKASKLTPSLLEILNKKALNFYITKLRDPLRNLCFEIKDNKDASSLQVLDFFIRMEQRFDKDFDLWSFKEKIDLFESKR